MASHCSVDSNSLPQSTKPCMAWPPVPSPCTLSFTLLACSKQPLTELGGGGGEPTPAPLFKLFPQPGLSPAPLWGWLCISLLVSTVESPFLSILSLHQLLDSFLELITVLFT